MEPQSKISPQMADAYKRVVLACMKVLYSDKTRELLKRGLTAKKPPADVLAQEVAGVLRLVDDRAQGRIPKEVMIPAGVAVMQDLVGFVQETKLFEVNEEVVKEALQKMIALLIQEYQVMAQQKGQAQQPQQGQPQPAPQQPQQMPPQAQQPQGLLGA